MTRSVAATSNAAITREAARPRSNRPSGTSFAEVQAAAIRDSKDKVKPAANATGAPKGERTQKVEGHSYAEIVSGPRNGMFLNNSGNARDGQAFVMVKRDGREFHIYGTGANRTVFEVGRDSDRDAPTPAAAGKPGTTGATGTKPSGSATPATT